MSGFYCQECGHAFKTVKAAMKASNGDRGCPKCGGSDIDLGNPKMGSRVVQSDSLKRAIAATKGGTDLVAFDPSKF